ncbi:MAG: VOC family protein [Longimicrobiales bacterium]
MFDSSYAFSSFSVDDLQRAKEFYGGTLGLQVSEDAMGLELHLTSGAKVFVYPKPDHAPATFTILNFAVDSVERAVDELTGAGVRFEIYDRAGLVTDQRGILADEHMKIAWFRDPAGNILSVLEDARAVREASTT